MKNLKKVLALAVAFVMCFTMFAGALVFTDVEPGGRYSEAVTILSDLGVISGLPDGRFGINETITRADACCLIARLMTGKNNPPKNSHAQVFTDVPSGAYYEDAVAYCVAYGVTVGTGNGKFSPELTITDGQFIAMLTRALGYDTADHPLSFPMGNISVAQQKGLLENVDVAYASDALRGEDAQMIYNALFADYDRAAKNMNVYQQADDHYATTIAEEVFGMGRLCYDASSRRAATTSEVDYRGSNIRQPVDCQAHTWVIAGVDAREKEKTYVAFAIDDDSEKAVDPTVRGQAWSYVTFTYENDIQPFLGYRVELWGDMSHDAIDKGYTGSKMDVMAIKTVEGQTAYGYHAGMYDGDNNNKITSAAEGKTLIMTRDKNVVNMAKIELRSNNWQTVAPDAYAYSLATVYEDTQLATTRRVGVNFQDGDQYKLIDWDSDDYIDFVVSNSYSYEEYNTYKYAEVKTLSSKRAVLQAADAKRDAAGNPVWGEYALQLDDDNLKVQADGIEEGDIVEISVVSREYDRNDEEVVTIKLTPVDPVTKTLEKINLTKDLYTFDGEELSLADRDLFDIVNEDDTYEDLRTRENVGQPFNIYFDRSGYIIKANVADDKARGYLMILDTYDGNSNLNSNSKRNLAAVDVLFDDNTVADEVEVVKDLKIDNVTNGTTGYDKSDRTWDQLKVVGKVFKYYMNEDNQITRLESQDDFQSADYAFDDSKDRISILDNNGNTVAADKNNYTNYSFADDAVIFAVRQPQVNNAAGDFTKVENKLGYIRVIPAEYHGDDDTAHSDEIDRYYVDPDDVIAVKVEDIPEIDNRTRADALDENNGVYNWTDDDVTHPYEILPTLKWDATTKQYTYRTIADLDNQNDMLLSNTTKTAVRPFHSQTIGKVNKTNYGYSYTFGDDIGDGWQLESWININLGIHLNVDAEDLKTPRIVYSFENKSGNDLDIQTALVGVDTLDYFNQSSVKLALITDVTYHGKDAYSIDAAIDGKVANFKTITGDESDIFTGRISSYDDMQSYLNQELNQYYGGDSFHGVRNGLYAEVTMNSDGLITKIRAMDVVESADETLWGNQVKDIGKFMEGNVYRVIRGVTTQIRTGSKETLVTFQPNPLAAGSDTLYQLSKNDDMNLYDNLESNFDSDTYFYQVSSRPNAARGMEASIDLGFYDDLSKDLKEATSDILEASEFITTNNDALYFMADYAVRKSDTDHLVAVFAFTDEMKNTNATVREVLSADDLTSSYRKPSDGYSAAVGQISKIVVEGEYTGANTSFGYTIGGKTVHFNVEKDSDERRIAVALGEAIEKAFGTTDWSAQNGVLVVAFNVSDGHVSVDDPDYEEGSVSFKHTVERSYQPRGEYDASKVTLPQITLRLADFYSYVTGSGKGVDFTITIDNIELVDKDGNSAVDTEGNVITKMRDDGTKYVEIRFQMPADDNTYAPADIVKEIEKQITAQTGNSALKFTTDSYRVAFNGFDLVPDTDPTSKNDYLEPVIKIKDN